jgi:cell division protein FtsB
MVTMSKDSLQPAALLNALVPRGRLLPVAAVLLLLMLGLAVFGDKGLVRAWHAMQQRDELVREVQSLEEANRLLRKEIDALRSDRRHLEGIARRELGMVGDDELIYQFPTKRPDSH